MPRRKAADRTAPVKTRSRNGCQECRASRVRCDTKKPICTRCWEKGLPCSTNLILKWESEFVSRGMAFGRAGVWSKSRPEPTTSMGPQASSPASSSDDTSQMAQPLPPIYPWGFINSGVATFENPEFVDVMLNEQRAIIPFSSQRLASQPSIRIHSVGDLNRLFTTLNSKPEPSLALFPAISEIGHGELFDYYLEQVCPRTTASSTITSPFASVILPFALSASPILFRAIQALGACHWSRLNPSYSSLGLRLKTETLRGLRRRLACEGPSTCCTDPEVLVIMMMLCLYEIIDKCDQHWTIHLKGAKDLIRLRRQQAGTTSHTSGAPDPVTTFAEHFFAFQDVMGRTACGEEVLFGSDYWKTDNRTIDLWMGCSPELVSILSTITEMSRARRQLDSDGAKSSFSLRAASLEHQLEHLIQEVGDEDDEMLSSAAEAKRLAAVLYLNCTLHGACPTTPLVVDYVQQILHLVSELLDRGSVASVTWPVFVAAVELDPSRDELWSDGDGNPVSGRSTVLRALSAMAESTISNIARTRAVVVQVWQARDNDMLKARQMECNDWECYVSPISTSMSLA
ncbi:hypothetical protein N7462_011042 [Penicillium macrosclerotiorum]|uniref:uncharacterized protein n=1 Tax=Penicillium macrosclerotiorum TaxID=303699 RepID=UPI00254659B7|nr:uncharacterized protein N7462_011042 [Penicillium macrosclerotiorum]KAJ5666633.1 hypothetical protein N7462_011042 [Penicillium macrosclerotiorum]